MKSKFNLVVTSILFATATVSAPQANAGIFIATGNVGGIVAGAILTGIGAATAISGAGVLLSNGNGGYDRTGGAVALLISGGVLAVGGIVLLPDNNPGTLEFVSLNKKQARTMGLSEEERTSYNADLPEINAVMQDLASEMRAKEQYSSKYARKLWDERKEAFNPMTRAAVNKVSAFSLK